MSAEEKAKEVVSICREHISGDEFIHLATWHELTVRFTAALLEAFAEGKRQSISAEQERQAEARGRRAGIEAAAKEAEKWWDVFDFHSFALNDLRRVANPNHIALCIRSLLLPAPTEGEGER